MSKLNTEIKDQVSDWISDYLQYKKSNVLVFSKEDFRSIKDLLTPLKNIAIISIESTESCTKYQIEERKIQYSNDHLLCGSDTVLNIEFDDVDKDRKYKEYLFKAITLDQARIILNFIERNIGKHFIIHCKAGKSRSQGVARFILDNYSEYYEECSFNKINPCVSPNYCVVSMLKRAYYEKDILLISPDFHPWFNLENHVNRLVKCYKNHGDIVIGYDFDGTIYDTNKIGGNFNDVIDLLRKCSEFGLTLCLWTAELDPEKLDWKVKYSRENGINVKYINESPLMPGTKKPYFNILLDDRAGLPFSYLVLSKTLEILDRDKLK